MFVLKSNGDIKFLYSYKLYNEQTAIQNYVYDINIRGLVLKNVFEISYI